ncbi:hypothetical protein LAJLEIBI_00933 [[Clostridium] hylemonae DSM 15053]|nr:DUF2610 domain-containing protein [[Clostridium] hylemonae]QEK16924.1 hypothetical protein LAJLEIBI_00933 [[Clostridium] hylemonae DSM 15053]
MFSIKKSEMITKTFRLPAETLKKLEELAQKNNISLNNLIIQCCEYALENLEPCAEEKSSGENPDAKKS